MTIMHPATDRTQPRTILSLDPLPVARYDTGHETVRAVWRFVAEAVACWPTHDLLLIGVQAEGLPRSWWSSIGHDWR
jgi:hypothetical protein